MTKELAIATAPNPASMIPYADIERMATAIAKSGLFGLKEPVQALALCLIAQAEGRHPASAAMDYHIIKGRPSLKVDTMLSRFIMSGGRVTWHRLDESCADATFSHPAGGEVRITWDLEMARKITIDEWSDQQGARTKRQKPMTEKDNWKNYPRAMLRARCVSEGVRTVFPPATGGLYTPEEVKDMPQVEKEITGEVVQMRKDRAPSAMDDLPNREPVNIGEDSDECQYLEKRIAELELDVDRVKVYCKRRWGISSFGALSPANYRELLGRLTEFARKIKEEIKPEIETSPPLPDDYVSTGVVEEATDG